MEQESAQPQDDTNPPPRYDLRRVLVQVPLRIAHSFEGLPNVEPSLRRRILTGTRNPDPERSLNDAEPPPPEDRAPSPTQAQEQLTTHLTVNRLCRAITIVVLGFWGGWSLMPEETKVPLSSTWVAYICIITDWVVFSTNLDCMYPTAMNWYFRKHLHRPLIVKKSVLPQVTVTGYSLLNTVVGVGIAIFKYIFRKDQPVLTHADLVVGSLIFACLYFLGCVERAPGCPGAWFFYDDYSTSISKAIRIMFALSSWWWIAFRILAIVKIVRSRDQPELAFQFFILAVGLTIEAILLSWFFLLPIFPCLFNCTPYDEDLWNLHLPPLLAMLVSWLLVIVLGLWKDLPNILFPCSGSTSMVCRALVAYAY